MISFIICIKFPGNPERIPLLYCYVHRHRHSSIIYPEIWQCQIYRSANGWQKYIHVRFVCYLWSYVYPKYKRYTMKMSICNWQTTLPFKHRTNGENITISWMWSAVVESTDSSEYMRWRTQLFAAANIPYLLQDHSIREYTKKWKIFMQNKRKIVSFLFVYYNIAI